MTLYDFEKYASSVILSRGKVYYKQKRVTLIDRKNNTYEFTVIGSNMYCVTIELDNDGTVASHLCSCPYQSFLCKHEVACLLYLKDMLKSKETAPQLFPQVIELDNELRKVDKNGDIKALIKVHEIFSTIENPDANLLNLHCVYRMYWFYYTGELIPQLPHAEIHESAHFLSAAIKLIQGDVDGALNDFRRGLEIKSTGLTNNIVVPYEPINIFLYICALGTRLNSEDAAILQRMYWGVSRKIENFYSCFELLISLILGKYVQRNMYVFSNYWFVSPWEKVFNKLISFYAFGPEKSVIDTLGCALLQNEEASLKGKEKSWPYEAILPRVRQMEKWESALSGLIDLMTSVSKAKDKEVRVVYFVRPYSNSVELRLQGKLKSGGYSKGKALSETRFRNADCPMDETDVIIQNAWLSSREYGVPPLTFILPFCVGHEKLFTINNYSCCIPVEVIEEKPYLSTVRKNGKINFVSNVSLEDLTKCHKDGLVYHWYDDFSTIKFCRIDDKMARVLQTLLELKSVPVEAEHMLESLFGPLKGRLEVQSDVKGGVKLERKEGSTVLCVRLKREMHYYLATFLAHPLDGGAVYLPAGAGNEVVIDSNAEGRYEVVRDLKKEKKVLRKAMEMLWCFSSENGIVMQESLLFALENPSAFKDLFYFEWPTNQELRLNNVNTKDFHITATGNGGWFELEGNLKVSEDVVLSVSQLLEMTRAGERFVKLGENEYLRLSDSIRSQLGRLASVAQKSRGKLVVPDLAMSMIADGVDDVVDIADEEALKERKKLIREASKLEITIPDGLNAVLRPYQEDGFRWMMRLSHWHAGACLADDMGLGKTVQTIAFLLAHATNGPQLVVAPTSVVGNWETEIHRFAPGLKVVMVNALGAAERKKAISNSGAGVVVLSTYGVLALESKTFAEVAWTSVVLDEAHTIKNKETKMSAAVMNLKARNRVILTGTPIQNYLGELWNLFRFINPGLLGSFEHFQETYVGSDDPSALDTLKRLVTPFMLRRTKTEVVKELPEKTEITIPVELSESEMAVYEVLRREARAELEQSSKLNVNALAMMTKLRMASCSASLVESSWEGTSSKLDVFAQKLQDIVDGGNNVLVFSQFTSFLALAKERAEALGIKDYLYLDGSTPAAKRRKMVDEFQGGKVPVFFISLKAGGLGLNLTGANYVIHLDPWWNPAIEQQATDRVYRIGQQQNVTVYHLISSGTIEEKILRLHSTKQQLADAILSGSYASNKLTAEQILELLG